MFSTNLSKEVACFPICQTIHINRKMYIDLQRCICKFTLCHHPHRSLSKISKQPMWNSRPGSATRTSQNSMVLCCMTRASNCSWRPERVAPFWRSWTAVGPWGSSRSSGWPSKSCGAWSTCTHTTSSTMTSNVRAENVGVFYVKVKLQIATVHVNNSRGNLWINPGSHKWVTENLKILHTRCVEHVLRKCLKVSSSPRQKCSS